MTLEAIVNEAHTLRLGDKEVTIKQLTTRNVLSLINLFNKSKGKLGIEPKDVQLSADGLMGLLRQLMLACELDDEGNLTGTSKAVFTEIGKLVGASAEDVVDASLDDLYQVLVALWEVNASGPLGQEIRRIIASLSPLLGTTVDLMRINFQSALIKGVQSGGTAAGGMTSSSPPSTDSSTGASATSWSSPSGEPSTSSPASDTSPDTKPPSSEPPTSEPTPEAEAEAISPPSS